MLRRLLLCTGPGASQSLDVAELSISTAELVTTPSTELPPHVQLLLRAALPWPLALQTYKLRQSATDGGYIACRQQLWHAAGRPQYSRYSRGHPNWCARACQL